MEAEAGQVGQAGQAGQAQQPIVLLLRCDAPFTWGVLAYLDPSEERLKIKIYFLLSGINGVTLGFEPHECDTVLEISSCQPPKPRPKPKKPNGQNPSDYKTNRTEADKILRPYTKNPKAAMSQIRYEDKAVCDITPSEIEAHFRDSYADRSGCEGPPPLDSASIPTAGKQS
ncbi:hypothetical protein FOCC_FOCC012907 [Frankliniella occidentalis]|nr:hypothetical protein FOCC_FOCC012907 [Frankliniella occidentalis]